MTYDALGAFPALAHLARACHHEGRRGRRAGDGVVEGEERRLARRSGDRADIGARDGVVVANQDLPFREQRAIALVEFVEAAEGKRRRAAQLDAAERGARPPRLAQVAVDAREAVAPRHGRRERRMHDLPAGVRHHAR